MNQAVRPTNPFKPTSAWRLWIDRCGGFSLLVGDSYTAGGMRPDGSADIQVQSDWRREEGRITRLGGDYFWRSVDEGSAGQAMLLSGGEVPIRGAAKLRMAIPSPLSRTAVLSLDPPHRFAGHVDQVVLVDHTVLIGPSAGDHLRCGSIETPTVLFFRDGGWKAKLKSGGSDAFRTKSQPSGPIDFVPGQRVTLGELDMMLEPI